MSWVIFTKTKLTIQRINISFKTFTKRDIDSVLLIERLSYEHPWNRAKFIDSLNNPRILASVILKNNQIVGYSIVQHSIDFADLLNICIHPKHQHQGFGRALFHHLQEQLRHAAIHTILLEVRKSNQSAVLFYESLGFEAIDVRKKYYANGEDAKIMRIESNNKA